MLQCGKQAIHGYTTDWTELNVTLNCASIKEARISYNREIEN